MPCSPKKQLDWISVNRPNIEISPESLKRYFDFVNSNQIHVNIGSMTKSQLKRIKSKLNQAWFRNIMMKRKVAAIDVEVQENFR